MEQIRNFAIIAHIDHGKSTLADRLLEITGTVKVGTGDQLLDTMELEKERGITIKLNPARMSYQLNGIDYQLNLIDTPGHVDFGYEVSRSLAAVEGVVLLVDATQGVQAQTISNLAIAKKLNLAIVPVVNKIDLPNAQTEETLNELCQLLDCRPEQIYQISAKTGAGVKALLADIIELVPPPNSTSDKPLRALVFDSFFDPFLGVIAYVKVVDGQLASRGRYRLCASQAELTPTQVGCLRLKRLTQEKLGNGEIGYVATGLKNLAQCRVGDTIAQSDQPSRPLPGYQQPKPMVFASIFPQQDKLSDLKRALEKLQLNDSSLTFTPTHFAALGSGFTIGCLGLLHLEIVRERLEREFAVSVVTTSPTVDYRQISEGWEEPWVRLEIVAPQRYFGAISELAARYRCEFLQTDYLADRSISYFYAPLGEIIVDFYNQLKSVSAGYASMDYQLYQYRPADLVRVDVLIAEEPVDALSQLIIRSKAESYGRFLVERLKSLIPRQNFAIKLQAVIGGKIIARADIPPFRKDVIAKLYGGDVTRKRKLLEKQRKGKKRMRLVGKVEIPGEVFVELLKRD